MGQTSTKSNDKTYSWCQQNCVICKEGELTQINRFNEKETKYCVIIKPKRTLNNEATHLLISGYIKQTNTYMPDMLMEIIFNYMGYETRVLKSLLIYKKRKDYYKYNSKPLKYLRNINIIGVISDSSHLSKCMFTIYYKSQILSFIGKNVIDKRNWIDILTDHRYQHKSDLNVHGSRYQF